MVYFRKSYITFLKKLEANNTAHWFQANLPAFETNVNVPFNKLIGDLMVQIRMSDPSVKTLPESKIYEIVNQRHGLFPNEVPYHTRMAAFISMQKGSTISDLGTYIKIDSNSILLRFGLLQCDPILLNRVREGVISDYDTLEYIINRRTFRSYFGELVGSKAGTLLHCHSELLPKYPLIANNSFYCEVTIDISLITAGKLLWLIMQQYRVAQPLLHYLKAIIDASVKETLDVSKNKIIHK